MTTNDGWDALVSKASLVVQSTEVDGKEKGERVEDVLLHKETELEEPLHWCHLGGLCSGGGGVVEEIFYNSFHYRRMHAYDVHV